MNDLESTALRRARALITPIECWTQRALARNAAGKAVASTDTEAVRWCATGAIERAGHELRVRNQRWVVAGVLTQVIQAARPPPNVDPHSLHLTWLNDGDYHPDLTPADVHRKVLDAFDAAIASDTHQADTEERA